MRNMTNLNPEYRDRHISACTNKTTIGSKRPLFMDIGKYLKQKKIVLDGMDSNTSNKPSDLLKSFDVPTIQSKTGLTTYQDEICHITQNTTYRWR